MSRLSAYILRQCTTAGLSLFVTAAFLVWITQTLRLFDLITAKGQDLLTLMGQAAMTTPPLSGAILYICMGIGLARTLRGMQETRELHSIHAGRRLPGLLGAIIWFAIGGALAVGLIVHWAEPISKRLYREWQADVAADLVGRTLTPHRFTEAAPGLVVFISGRNPDGSVTGFFADDSRNPNARRTYTADRAVIATNNGGYFLDMGQGTLQYLRNGVDFSEVKFSNYQLALDRLTEPASPAASIDESESLQMLVKAGGLDGLSSTQRHVLSGRMAEIGRILVMCLFVTSLAAFPHARRRRNIVPIEVLVIAAGLGDRALSQLAEHWPTGFFTGQLILLAISVPFLFRELGVLRLPAFRRAAA